MFEIGTRAHDYGNDTPENLFKSISADGFTAIMLAYQKAFSEIPTYYDVNDNFIKRVQQALVQNQLKLETLGVYMELGSIDENIRQNALSHFKAGMHVAHKMGVKQVASETTSTIGMSHSQIQEACVCLQRSVEELLPLAQNLNINICLEPVFCHTLSSAVQAKKLIDDMQSEHLKIVFDPVNLIPTEAIAKQHDVWNEAFDLLGEYISCVHIKGLKLSTSRMRETCTLQESIIDYKDIFSKLYQLNKNLHLIREETNPKTAKSDIEFCSKFLR